MRRIGDGYRHVGNPLYETITLARNASRYRPVAESRLASLQATGSGAASHQIKYVSIAQRKSLESITLMDVDRSFPETKRQTGAQNMIDPIRLLLFVDELIEVAEFHRDGPELVSDPGECAVFGESGIALEIGFI